MVYSFTQVSGASLRYGLQIDTTEKFCSPIAIETTDTAYNINNLSSQTHYFWRVRGKNNFNYGSGEWSEIRTFTVKNTVAVENKNYSDSRIFSIVRWYA